LSLTLFGIYIDKLGGCLEDKSDAHTTLIGVVIILPFYIDDIGHMVRSPYGLGKELRILKNVFSSMDMTLNIDKIKMMII